jgi:hypothetical protein
VEQYIAALSTDKPQGEKIRKFFVRVRLKQFSAVYMIFGTPSRKLIRESIRPGIVLRGMHQLELQASAVLQQ